MATENKQDELQGFIDRREYWWWATKARSPRTNYLRKAVWSKGAKGASYLPGITMDEYGPIIYAEAFGNPDAIAEPYIMTYAKAVTMVNDRIPVFVIDQSRIIGCCASAPHKMFWVPVGSYSANEDMLNDKDDLVEPEFRDKITASLDILKPWTQQTLTEKILSRRQMIMARTSQVYTGGPHLETTAYCTSQFSYYKKGFKAIIEEIDGKLAEADAVLYKVGAKPEFKDENIILKELITGNQ